MRQLSLLLLIPFPSFFPINKVVIILTSFELLIRILTPFVCSDELVYRAALFLPNACLVVADILVLLLHNLGVVVEVVEVLQLLSREPNALNFVFVQLS